MWLKHKNKCYLFVAEFPRNKCLVPEVLFERLFFSECHQMIRDEMKVLFVGKMFQALFTFVCIQRGREGRQFAEQFHRFHTFPLFIFMIFISISVLFCIKASQKKNKRAESRLCLRDCHSICHDSKMVKWKSFGWLLMLMSHSCHNCQHMCTMFIVRHIHQLECRIRYTESIPTKFIHKILAVNVLQSIDWVNLWDLAPSNVIEHISGVPTNKQSNIA